MRRSMTLQALWRYPVKSMLGEELASVEIGECGLEGDRGYAMVDQETGAVVSAKQPRLWRNLLSASARRVDGTVQIFLPGQPAFTASDPDAHERLSAFVNRPVKLSSEPASGADIDRADPEEVLDRGLDAVVEAPKLVLGEAVPGPSFLDYAPLHIITTATLEHIGKEAPRYRPNLIVQTPPGYPPFAENEWVGSTISVGDQVVLRGVIPTPRCAIPTLAHGFLSRDPAALRVLMKQNRVDVPGFGVLPAAGVYVTVEREGTVERGAAVTV